jgi:flagellar motor switch protein FliN
MTAADPNANVQAFIESWRQSLAQSLADAGIKSAKVEFLDAKNCAESAANAGPKSYRLTINASGNLRGTLKFVLPETEALQLSAALTPGQPAATEVGDKQRESLTQLISKVAGKAIAYWGRDRIKLSIAAATADPGTPESAYGGLRITAENLTITLLLVPSPDLLEAAKSLEKPAAANTAINTQTGAPTVTTNQPAPPATPNAAPTVLPAAAMGSNLGLLFDVQLEATIRFGGRQLLLRDILSLSPGSVIELDRQVGEPAELLVAGRLVARGEVVVVDGNFGLRVTELTNPAQRNELVPA